MSQVEPGWTFLSNHGHVYFLLAVDQNIVVREIASKVGITERFALSIIQDLENAGYIKREKVGRSNHYTILPKKNLRHPLESKVQLKNLVSLIEKA